MSFMQTFKGFKRSYTNYLSVMYNIRKKEPIIRVKLRNGQVYHWNIWKVWMFHDITAKVHSNNVNIDFNFDDDTKGRALKFAYKGRPLFFLNGELGDITEVFVEEGYKFLDVENENVFDIGANVGDSTIYFAVNNAKRVLGLEPYPYPYQIALENLEKNNLGNQKVTFLNAGYGEDGLIKVKTDIKTNIGNDLMPSNEGTEIRTISLKTLLKEYDYGSQVLKMDCEGCEYNLLKEDKDTLKKFKRIQIEYHYGYEKLKEKLENSGFVVSFTKPLHSYNKYASNPNMVVGQIYARLALD